MSEVLHADDLGKAYVTFDNELLRFGRWFGLPTKPSSERWVLRHVGFRLQRGEALGIVGENGAGKSTLLKLLTGTTRPTEGSVRIAGRVSALLELGLGFDPELTGRENARHVSALMGVPPEKIDELIPAIEEFAEIGRYFDEPVRMYSSGMQMRVAFSTATAIRPEILIVDEALAVGDAYFVHKSYQRIRQFREQGTALLIVSHDPSAVQSLCDRALLLESGRSIADGNPREVLDLYNALIADKEERTVRTTRRGADVVTESGTGEARFLAIEILDRNGTPSDHVRVQDRITLRARVKLFADLPRLVFGYMIRDRLGQPIYGTNTQHTDQVITDLQAGEEVEFHTTFDADLGVGSYSISVALHGGETHLVNNYQWKDLAAVFTVANPLLPTFVGCAHIPPNIEVRRAPAADRDATPDKKVQQ